VRIDDPDELEAPELAGKRAERKAQAERVFAAASPRWRPLVALAMEPDPTVRERFQGLGSTTPMLGRGSELVVHFAEPVLTIEQNGKIAFRRAFPQWSDRPFRGCPTCTACPGALSDLDAAYVDAGARVMLIVLRLGGGTDVCWEHGPTYHTVRY
jgi:hypothetical protein